MFLYTVSSLRASASWVRLIALTISHRHFNRCLNRRCVERISMSKSWPAAAALSVENWVLVHLLTSSTASCSWEVPSQCLGHFERFRMPMKLVLKTQVSPICHHPHTHEYSFSCSLKGLLCRWKTGLSYLQFQCHSFTPPCFVPFYLLFVLFPCFFLLLWHLLLPAHVITGKLFYVPVP